MVEKDTAGIRPLPVGLPARSAGSAGPSSLTRFWPS